MGNETSDSTGDAAAPQPLLRVVRGDATEAEVAAVVAVLLASRVAGEPAAPASPNGWVNRSRSVRSLPAPGPGAWRAAIR